MCSRGYLDAPEKFSIPIFLLSTTNNYETSSKIPIFSKISHPILFPVEKISIIFPIADILFASLHKPIKHNLLPRAPSSQSRGVCGCEPTVFICFKMLKQGTKREHFRGSKCFKHFSTTIVNGRKAHHKQSVFRHILYSEKHLS